MTLRKRKQRGQKAYRFGLFAEKVARWFLRLKGYKILDQRLRTPFGEIDIVAQKQKTLIIVEVKARHDLRDAHISYGQQQRLFKAGLYIQGQYDLQTHITMGLRFDALFIIPYRMPYHIINAWEET